MAGPYDGTYRYDNGWNCRDIGSDGGAIRIANGRSHGVENNCRMTNPVAIRGMKATLYDRDCSGEGETWSDRIMLMRQDGGKLLIVNQGVSHVWQRCP
jgi:hypothetical protein